MMFTSKIATINNQRCRFYLFAVEDIMFLAFAVTNGNPVERIVPDDVSG